MNVSVDVSLNKWKYHAPVLVCSISIVLVVASAPPRDLAARERKQIAVFITSEVLKDGWVAAGAKERADSARDLRRAIRYEKGPLAVTDKKDRADLVVQVLGREDSATGAVIDAVRPTQLAYAKMRRGKMIWATVYVGNTKFEFLGTTDQRYWSAAAQDLAKDLQQWARDNYERIVIARQRQ